VQRTIQAEAVDVVLEIKTVLFRFVIWENVLAFLVGVVSATILESIASDGGA
jgi:hypothetical protein